MRTRPVRIIRLLICRSQGCPSIIDVQRCVRAHVVLRNLYHYHAECADELEPMEWKVFDMRLKDRDIPLEKLSIWEGGVCWKDSSCRSFADYNLFIAYEIQNKSTFANDDVILHSQILFLTDDIRFQISFGLAWLRIIHSLSCYIRRI